MRVVATILECLIWLMPIGLTAFVHNAASVKAGQPFIVENASTDNRND